MFAIVATAGTTNVGVVDDLAGAAVGRRRGGRMAARRRRLRRRGAGRTERPPPVRRHRAADSFIVDPHKWLFAPFDSCALCCTATRRSARAAHTQHAEYLDVLHAERPEDEPWNASDYAHHLSRRARGLPLWFSLATHGTDAYIAAVETTLEVTRDAARLIERAPHTELLMEPELSVVMFRRTGWSASQYQAWSDGELASGTSFVVPTTLER